MPPQLWMNTQDVTVVTCPAFARKPVMEANIYPYYKMSHQYKLSWGSESRTVIDRDRTSSATRQCWVKLAAVPTLPRLKIKYLSLAPTCDAWDLLWFEPVNWNTNCWAVVPSAQCDRTALTLPSLPPCSWTQSVGTLYHDLSDIPVCSASVKVACVRYWDAPPVER